MAVLSYNGARFVLRDVDKERAKAAGFHFDYQNRVWWTGLISCAEHFRTIADKFAKERFNREENQIALSKAIDANIDIPCPEGLAYLGFQKAGVAFALARKDTLIADVMRLGKSVQSCGVINADTSIKNILVICPAFLKINWARELQKWLVRKLIGEFATSKELPGTEIVIANYEIIGKLRDKIDKRAWDLLIMDESHFLKNSEAIRTKSCLGWQSQSGKSFKAPIEARRRIALTGTPILNRPIELWPLCRVFDPEGLGASHWAFAKKYCLPPKAPVLMSDLTEKPISEMRVGDKIIGWKRANYQRRLCESEVLDVLTKEYSLQEVRLNDGTTIVCTPDHEWLSERRDWAEYNIAKTGKLTGRGGYKASRMVRIIDSGLKPQFLHEKDYRLGYLLGFFRGEGWCSKTRRVREYAFKGTIFSGTESHSIGVACLDPEPIARCHKYLTEFEVDHREPYVRKEDGMHEIDCGHSQAYSFFTASQPDTDAWWAGFLGGIYDAEGSHSHICQTKAVNPSTYKMITNALSRFNFKYSEHRDVVTILCEREEWLRFWFIASPSLTRKMKLYLFGVPSRGRIGFGKDVRTAESYRGSGGKFMKKVVRPINITPLPGIHKVYTLTTTTGNYVAYGIGSKNCNAYKNPAWGWDFSGASNLEDLSMRLRSSFMIRRTKEQVLPELPPIRRQIIPIPAEVAKRVVNAELEFFERNKALVESSIEEAQKAQTLGDEESYKAATAKLKSIKQVAFEEMSILRHATAVAKIPYIIEYLEDCLENEDKVVCFCHHHDVIGAIAKHFGEKAVQHHGKLNPAQKQLSVDRFKDDPKCTVFLGGISCAAGYSLAIATLVIMGELSWVPGDMDQAEKRLDAIDQMDSILVQHLVFDGSLDARMAKRVIRKQEDIKTGLGDNL